MAVSKRSLENLIPPQKGEVRNPKGKEPGTLSFKASLRKMLAIEETKVNELTNLAEVLTQQDLLNIAQIKKAKEGDTQAYNAIIDRLEGKPTQSIDNNHTGNVGINWIEQRTYDSDQKTDEST